MGAEQLGLHCDELTIDSFSVVVNLDRISPRFEDQGSKSDPTASSSLSLFFLPRSWKPKNVLQRDDSSRVNLTVRQFPLLVMRRISGVNEPR